MINIFDNPFVCLTICGLGIPLNILLNIIPHLHPSMTTVDLGVVCGGVLATFCFICAAIGSTLKILDRIRGE